MSEVKIIVNLEECPSCGKPHKNVTALEEGLFECPDSGKLNSLCEESGTL